MKISILLLFFLLTSSSFFIKHNSKTIRCVKILNIPNDCSSNSFKQTTRYVLDFSKRDFDSLNSYLLDIDFTPCFVRDNINCAWQLFKGIILKATSLFIPKVKLKSHQPPQWFTPAIRHHLNRIHTIGVAHGGSGGQWTPHFFVSGCGSGNCYAYFVDARTRLI